MPTSGRIAQRRTGVALFRVAVVRRRNQRPVLQACQHFMLALIEARI
jgi:hypothetical protein